LTGITSDEQILYSTANDEIVKVEKEAQCELVTPWIFGRSRHAAVAWDLGRERPSVALY